METLDTTFAQMVREHKSTIYTVCFMFSKDSDEVSDLFQEVLINLWKGYASFQNRSSVPQRRKHPRNIDRQPGGHQQSPDTHEPSGAEMAVFRTAVRPVMDSLVHY